MRFRQNVGAIGLLVHIFLACCPKDCSVQKLCVLRRIRQARNIEASTLAVYVGRHLHFANAVISLKSFREYNVDNICFRKGKNILLVFTVVNRVVNAIHNEVSRMRGKIVLAFAHRHTAFLVYAKYVRKLEEFAVSLKSSRLAYTDETTAVVDEFANSRDDFLVSPKFTTTPSRTCITCINYYVKFRQSTCLHVFKVNEMHVYRHTAERFINALIGVALLIPKLVRGHVTHPATNLTPSIKNRNLRKILRRLRFYGIVDIAEFIANIRRTVDEFRELRRKLKVATETDSIKGITHHRSTSGNPVVVKLCNGIVFVAVKECVGEEIRQETPFLVSYAFYVGKHTHGYATTNRANERIKTKFLVSYTENFRTNPAIAKEHHRFFTVLMRDFNKLLHRFGDEVLNELHPVLVFLARNTMGLVIIACVYKVFCTHLVAVFLFKIVEHTGANRHIVAEPVNVSFLAELIVHEREHIQEGGETNNVAVGVFVTPALQVLANELLCLRIVRVVHNVMRFIPVVCNVVVHMYWMPQRNHQECNGVLMERDCIFNNYVAVFHVNFPFITYLPRSSVHNFHVFDCIGGEVGLHLLVKEGIHQMYGKSFFRSRDEGSHHEHVLPFVGVVCSPFVVATVNEIHVVYLICYFLGIFRKFNAITVTNGIRAPQIRNSLRPLYVIFICRDCNSTLSLIHNVPLKI